MYLEELIGNVQLENDKFEIKLYNKANPLKPWRILYWRRG